MSGFFRLTIGKKLWMLTFIMTGLMAAIVILEGRSLRSLSKSLNEIGHNQLPMVRAMSLADMMHDGLRSTIYLGIFHAQRNDREAYLEAHKENQEFSENIIRHLETIQALKTSPEMQSRILKARAEVDNYVAAGKLIFAKLDEKKINEAIALLDNYQKSFESLEAELGELGDQIEKNAAASLKAGDQTARDAEEFAMKFAVMGALAGALFSIWINISLARSLKRTVRQLSGQRNSLRDSTEAIDQSSSELASVSSQQATALQQSAASLEEIHAMTLKTSEDAEKLSRSSRNSHEAVDEGQSALHQVVREMSAIDQSNQQVLSQVRQSQQQMENIIRIIKDIGERTNVINDIVFQTRILSFNASIEAARAGHHGKGFAVVAEEVGKLAQMSGHASQEISKMLEEGTRQVSQIIENNTVRIGDLVEKNSQTIENGKRATDRCGEIFNTVVNEVNQVAQLSQSISGAIREQTTGINEVNQAVNLLNSTSEKGTMAAESNVEVSEKLKSQFHQLNSILSELEGMVGAASASGQASPTSNLHQFKPRQKAA